MGLVDDLLILPNPIKYFLMEALVLGLAIDIPLVPFKVSFGDIFFFPIAQAASLMHIYITYNLFVILFSFLLVIMVILNVGKNG